MAIVGYKLGHGFTRTHFPFTSPNGSVAMAMIYSASIGTSEISGA